MLEVAKDDSFNISLQPGIRPISLRRLAEVRSIYAGLVMVEAKCIEEDQKLVSSTQPKLNHQQWQALITLHRTLLYEHHDFLLASQHPSADLAIQKLALSYNIPTRIWLHGVHTFLKVLRHHLPASLDFMLAFIYLSYSTIALFSETIPVFADTWFECLGEISWYRMALEEDNSRDRGVWTYNARNWYSKASDRAPTTGRLYHRRAVLARPDALQELCSHSKSICVTDPFKSARTSMLTLFNQVLLSTTKYQRKLSPLDAQFVRTHGLLFTKTIEGFDDVITQFLRLLNIQLKRITSNFVERGHLLAISNICATLDFGSKDNVLMRAIDGRPITIVEGNPDSFFKRSRYLHHKTLAVVLDQVGDPKVLPFLHVFLVFMRYISQSPCAINLWEIQLPLLQLATMLNALLDHFSERVEYKEFPEPVEGNRSPFPEDYELNGLLWTRNYFPKGWFIEEVEDNEKAHETALTTPQRKERILWLAYHVAICNNSLLCWDSTRRIFSTEFEPNLADKEAY
jgi:hypothetical protein